STAESCFWQEQIIAKEVSSDNIKNFFILGVNWILVNSDEENGRRRDSQMKPGSAWMQTQSRHPCESGGFCRDFKDCLTTSIDSLRPLSLPVCLPQAVHLLFGFARPVL